MFTLLGPQLSDDYIVPDIIQQPDSYAPWGNAESHSSAVVNPPTVIYMANCDSVAHVPSPVQEIPAKRQESILMHAKSERYEETSINVSSDCDTEVQAGERNVYDDQVAKIIFGCDECYYSADTEDEMRKHLEKKHQDNPYACQICDHEFENKSILKAHISEGCSGKKMCGNKSDETENKDSYNDIQSGLGHDGASNERVLQRKIVRIKVLKELPISQIGHKLMNHRQFVGKLSVQRYLIDTSHDPRAKITDWPPFEIDVNNKWQCKICTKKGRNVRFALEHVRRHTTFRLYRCGYCHKNNDIRGRFSDHVKARHGITEVRMGRDYFKNPLPEVYYLNQESLREIYGESSSSEGDSEDDGSDDPETDSKYNEPLINEQIKSGQIVRDLPSPIVLESGSFKCNYCIFSSPKGQESVIKHQLDHVSWKPWKCRLCSFKHATKTVVIDHIKKVHHGGKYTALHHIRECPEPRFYVLNKSTCGILGLKPSSKSALKIKKNKSKTLKQTATDSKECDSNTISAPSNDPMLLEVSLKTIPDPVSIIGEVYSCNFCNKIGNEMTIDQHQKFHFIFRPFMCNVCGYQTVTVSRIQGHMQAMHSSENANYAVYPNPPQYYFTKATIKSLGNRIHRFSIHGKEKCPRCMQVLDDKDAMTTHLANYHPECVQYKCEYCQEKVFTKSDYEAHHIEIHSLTPFQFTILRFHDIGLTSGNPCNICGIYIPKEFPIALHMAEEHADKIRISCSLCGKAFKFREKLRLHFTATHPGTEVAYTISLPGYQKRPTSPKLSKKITQLHAKKQKVEIKTKQKNKDTKVKARISVQNSKKESASTKTKPGSSKKSPAKAAKLNTNIQIVGSTKLHDVLPHVTKDTSENDIQLILQEPGDVHGINSCSTSRTGVSSDNENAVGFDESEDEVVCLSDDEGKQGNSKLASQKNAESKKRGRPSKGKSIAAAKKPVMEESNLEKCSPEEDDLISKQQKKKEELKRILHSMLDRGEISEDKLPLKVQHLLAEDVCEQNKKSQPVSKKRKTSKATYVTSDYSGEEDTEEVQTNADTNVTVHTGEEQENITQKDIEDKLSEYTECPQCCVSFKNEWNLFYHLKVKHPEVF